MLFTLSNEMMDFKLDHGIALWNMVLKQIDALQLDGMRASICWTDQREGVRRYEVIDSSSITKVSISQVQNPFEAEEGICIEAVIADGSVSLVQEFCPGPDNSLLCRITVQNLSSTPRYIDHITLFESHSFSRKVPSGGVDAAGVGSGLTVSNKQSSLRCFINGWQSWSPAGSYGANQYMPRSRLTPFLDPMHNATGRKIPTTRGHYVSDFFGVIGIPGQASLLIGFLTQQQAFGQLEVQLDTSPAGIRLWEDTDQILLGEGQSYSTDWAILQPVDLTMADPLQPYMSLAARANDARNSGPIPVGWCSWYHYFQQITEEELLKNVSWISEHQDRFRFNLIQLDDGFEADVGDWYHFSPGFPEGVSRASSEITRNGFQPGLWLAPFIVKPGAVLVDNHPDWIIRNRNGKPVNGGFVWNRFTSGLDVSHPGIQDFTKNLIRTAVSEWGFSYLKLDFLYAGVLKGRRYNQSQTRAQALSAVFQQIRDAAGQDVTLLGCGCPLGSGVGTFDLMRIGADVAPKWTPAFMGISFPFRKEPAFPSARNSIRSILARMPMHRRLWVNDPDCLLLRGTETELSEAEVQSLVVAVSLSAGVQIISDDLPGLQKLRKQWLSFILPPLKEAAEVVDWFDRTDPEYLIRSLKCSWDEWYLAARINWLDQPVIHQIGPVDFNLPEEESWFVFDIWKRKVILIAPQDTYESRIEPHGTGFYGLRRKSSGPQWLGDTLHISQGGLIQAWVQSSGGLEITLETDRLREGEAWLFIPGKLSAVHVDGTLQVSIKQENGIIRIPLKLWKRHNLCIEFETR
ncbi:MAG: alpha-galactosidase [Anaerolineales bacterium]|nr:alpha-galactosidase [Anaerolineales bacterium]